METLTAYRALVGKPIGKQPLERQSGKVILKWILQKCIVRVWTWWNGFRIVSTGMLTLLSHQVLLPENMGFCVAHEVNQTDGIHADSRTNSLLCLSCAYFCLDGGQVYLTVLEQHCQHTWISAEQYHKQQVFVFNLWRARSVDTLVIYNVGGSFKTVIIWWSKTKVANYFSVPLLLIYAS